MNVVILSGHLARDVELRYTNSTNKAVATITLAVKRPFAKDTTDFVTCVAWDKDAENIEKYFEKGDFIQIRGYLTFRQYEVNKESGQEKRTATEVIVQEWGFGGSKKKDEPKDEPKEESVEAPTLFEGNEFVPF